MHYGLTIFPTDYSISPADIAREAESRGFESIWFPEHSHIPASRESPWPGGADLPKMYYETLDPFVALTAAAAATTKIKVATGICLVIQRDPIQTAKSIASLDQVSNGRFLFGIGAGWNLEEMRNHGTRDPKRRFALMRERIEAMKAIWTEEKAEASSSTSTRSSPGPSRSRSPTRRSTWAGDSPAARAARCATATAGSRSRAGTRSPTTSPRCARWPSRPAATPTRSR